MTENDFKSLFDKIARTEYGDKQKLEEIESQLAHLRKGNPLSYHDLEIISDPKFWPFSKYWMWPERNQLKNKLDETTGWFKNLPSDEKKIISGLNKIFKNISLVSIILRFAVPEHYAIYSRPTLQILRVERGRNDVEEYLNYVQEMRILKDAYRVEKASEVDMIVWAIFFAKGRHVSEFKKRLSQWLPENLTPEELIIYHSHDPIKIAKEYLKRNDHMTAGFWAAKAFEKLLYEECLQNGIFIAEQAHKRSKMIKALIDRTLYWKKPKNRNLLYETKYLRNKIIPGVKSFTSEDVEDFISNILRLRRIAAHRGY